MARRGAVLLASALAVTGSTAATLPADAASNGLLAPYVVHDPGGETASVAIGDVTGDRLDDVVLTTAHADDPAHAYSVWVYPQLADGSLGHSRLASWRKLQREIAAHERRTDPAAAREHERQWRTLSRARRNDPHVRRKR